MYTLNKTGYKAIVDWIAKDARPGVNAWAFYDDAEQAADALDDGFAAIVEMGGQYTQSGNPETINLPADCFDRCEVAP